MFFTQIFELIENINNRQVIAAGDWNVVLNPQVDARNYRSYNPRPRSRKVILDNLDILNLVDVYRKVYPNKMAYSWRRFNTIQQSRLDYFIISDSLTIKITDVNIQPGYRSDHSIVTITLINQHIEPKIKSYWKLNNSLLHDKTYIDLINDTILEIKKQYAVPIYNTENIKNINDEELQFTINDQLFFEVLLLEIRGKTIAYASYKKKQNEKEEKELQLNISQMENKANLTQEQIENLEYKKILLQEYREKKIRGMIVRSRLQWLEDGERPSRYFCNLENRNFSSKKMCFLINDNGDPIFDQKDILNETKFFYQNLYKKMNIVPVNLNNIIFNQPKLSDLEKETLEGKIHYQEALSIVNNMKNNKSPGNSGFTSEFYKTFFNKIGHFLVRSINCGFDTGILSITQRQGVITCLPKEGKNTQLLSNWRPISLLNVSFKIASACIAQRIRNVLHKLINSNQKDLCQTGLFQKIHN